MTSNATDMPKVAVVIPVYKAEKEILSVMGAIPEIVSQIIVVDDHCPNQTGKLVQDTIEDKRVEVVFNETNQGVGGAVIRGYKRALEGDSDIIVKVDGDGQMDPSRIPQLIAPILNGQADYTKGNRFDSLEDLEQMPKIRIFGNAVLSLMSKVSSGYWNVTDPTNGFTAIHRSVLERIHLGKLRKGWFFESDILFRLAIIKAVVADVAMPASYGLEKSNLNIRKVIIEFPRRYFLNLVKRIFYLYYLREWSVGSIELPLSFLLMTASVWQGFVLTRLDTGSREELIVGIQFLLFSVAGIQFLLAFIQADIQKEPSKQIQVRVK